MSKTMVEISLEPMVKNHTSKAMVELVSLVVFVAVEEQSTLGSDHNVEFSSMTHYRNSELTHFFFHFSYYLQIK